MSDREDEGAPHRVSESVREIVVVVVSILIAFGLDAWWDGVSQRRELRERIPTVLAEMSVARAQLDEALGAHGGAAARAREVRRLLLEPGPDAASVAVPDTLVVSLTTHFVMDIPTSVTNRFIEAGGLGVIEDPELVDRMGRWTGLMQDAVDDQAQLRFEVQTQLVPALVGAGDLGDGLMRAAAERERRRAARAGASPPGQGSPLGSTVLRPSPELLNLLALRAVGETVREEQMVRLLAMQDSLVAALRAEVERVPLEGGAS